MTPDEERARRQAINQQRLVKTGNPLGTPAAAPVAPTDNPAYSYQDPGMFGDPNYSYQVGDEFTNPGEEPPAGTPEHAAWQAHAKAWRHFIGGRQQYVDSMIGAGYNPEDLGITPQKEQGRAGYLRLTAPGMMDKLHAQSAQYMRGTDAQIDPVTGLYMTGGPGAGQGARYYDARGLQVNAQGHAIGGMYGQQNTIAQFGQQAIPRAAPANAAPVRPTQPRPTVAAPVAPPAPRVSAQASNYGGWGDAYGARPLAPSQRNRQPRARYVPSPMGI